jgi:outer membrane lipoprotein-sorting protein
MQILSAFPFIYTLLVFFPSIIHARPSTALPNDYIIKAKEEHGQIFSADGKVAYQYAPELNTPSKGETSMTIKDGSAKKLFTLVSVSCVITKTING